MFINLKKTLRNPYVFSILSKVFVVLFGFLFTVVQSRYLGPAIKGQIAYVSSITSITSVLFGLGIHQAYPYFKKKYDVDLLPFFMKISLFMLVLYVVIAVVAVLSMGLEPQYIAICLITPLLVYNRIVEYITLVEVPNKKNGIEMFVYAAELIFVIVLWFAAPASFVLGVVVIAFKDAVQAVVYTFMWRKRIFGSSALVRGLFFPIVRFGFFPMLSLLMTTLNYRVDIIMLEGHVADAAIGIYSVGVMLAERIWMIPDAMKGVMISNITKGKDVKEVSYVIRISNTACLLIVLVIIVVGKPFIDIVFGSQYDGAYQVTLILMSGVFFMIYYKMIASYNIVIGKQNISFIFLGISVLSNIIANFLLIPLMGIYGAGVASVISYGMCSMLFIIYFHFSVGVSIREMLLLTKADYNKLKDKLRMHK